MTSGSPPVHSATDMAAFARRFRPRHQHWLQEIVLAERRGDITADQNDALETALDELKTHLRGSKIVLRSKTPDLVRQEFYGLMMAHFAIRGLMHEAALKADVDPDRLSFVHAVRVVRRKLAICSAIPPSAQETVP